MGLLDFIADMARGLKEYPCMECRTPMDKVDDVLICPNYGYSVEVEDWISDPDKYDSMVTYVTKYDDPDYEEYGEDYDDIFGVIFCGTITRPPPCQDLCMVRLIFAIIRFIVLAHYISKIMSVWQLSNKGTIQRLR